MGVKTSPKKEQAHGIWISSISDPGMASLSPKPDIRPIWSHV